MRLIDADKVIELIEDEIIDCDDDTVLANGCRAGLTYARSIVATRPTIDAEPVRHGRWQKYRYPLESGMECILYQCSECGARFQEVGYGWPYCPECGAKMDGGTDNAID